MRMYGIYRDAVMIILVKYASYKRIRFLDTRRKVHRALRNRSRYERKEKAEKQR